MLVFRSPEGRSLAVVRVTGSPITYTIFRLQTSICVIFIDHKARAREEERKREGFRAEKNTKFVPDQEDQEDQEEDQEEIPKYCNEFIRVYRRNDDPISLDMRRELS